MVFLFQDVINVLRSWVHVPDDRPATVRGPVVEPAPDCVPDDGPAPVHGPDNGPAPVRGPGTEPAPVHGPDDGPAAVRVPDDWPTPVHGPDIVPSLDHVPDDGPAPVLRPNKLYCDNCRRSFSWRGWSRHKYTCNTKRRNCRNTSCNECPEVYCKKHKQWFLQV